MRKYKKIWDAFLANEAADFEKERNLTVKEIKRIGIRKFIKANDWRDEGDITKWRTDVLTIVPCPNCRQDFGILDDSLGLCNKCKPLYDLDMFYKDVHDLCKDAPSKIGQAMAWFMVNKKARNKYLKKDSG